MVKNYGQLYLLMIGIFIPFLGHTQVTDCNGQPFIVTISGDSTICMGSSSVLDAGPDYTTYEWSTGENTQSISVDAAGVYSVSVTNDENCITSDSIVVTILPLPIFQINGDSFICENEVDVLIGSPGFAQYAWSTGANSQIAAISSPGTYILTVTDDNGCSSVDSLEVVQGSTSFSIIGDTLNCGIDSTLLTLSDDFDAYMWSTGEQTSSIWVSSTDNYSVTVTADNACQTIDSIDIVVSNPSLNINGDTSFCESAFTTLIASPGFSEYEWSTGFPSQVLAIAQGGTYSVTATDDFGCEFIDSIEVVQSDSPTLTILGGNVFCSGDSITLSAVTNGDSYEWSNSVMDQDITINMSSTYSVTATSSEGCETVESIFVNELTSPDPQIQGDAQFCIGETGQLSVDNSFDTYLWSTNEDSAEIQIQTGDTYIVTVTDDNGCTGIDSIQVQVNDPQVAISGDLGFCPGDFTVLIASPGFQSYMWSNNIPAQVSAVSAPGTYSVTVMDSDGCFATDSVMVTELETPIAMISGDSIFCFGDSLVLDGGDDATTYLWSIPGEIGQTLTVNTPGSYSLTVTNGIGCEATDNIFIEENPAPSPQIEGIPLICSGNPTSLIGEDGFESYEWTGGVFSQELDIPVPGNYTLTVVDSNNCTGSTTVLVDLANQAAFVDISGDDEFCDGQSTTLMVDDIFTLYEWSTGDNTSTANISEGGTISIYAIDANGCPSIDSINVIVNDLPDVVIDGSYSFCEDEFTTLSTTENYNQYNWSTGENSASIEINEEGIVTVVVVDQNGCSGFDIVFIDEISAPDPIITGDLSLCPGQESTLMVSEGFESYQWSTGDSTNMIQVMDGGIYGVTVAEDNGCLGTYLIFVSEVPGVDLSISVSDTTVCEGQTVEVIAEGNFGFVNWSTGDNMANTVIDSTGDYIVEAGNFFGCTVYDTVSIEVRPFPIVEISGDSILCLDAENPLTSNFDPQEYDFQWSVANETSDTLTVNQAGTYNLTITDDIGCSGEDTFEVIQAENPLDSIVGIAGFCQGGSTVLTAEGPFDQIEWSNATSDPSLVIDIPGIYSVTATDTNGCEVIDSVEVVEFANPQISILGDEVLCEGTVDSLQIDGLYNQLIWNDQTNEDILLIDTEGTYSVEALSIEGCSSFDTIMVQLQENPSVVLEGDTLFCESTTIDINANSPNANVQFDWSEGSSDVSVVSIFQSGVYTVTVTDEFGCQGQDSLDINFYPPALLGVVGMTSFCPGDTSTLTALGPYTQIEWSTGEMTSFIEVENPGNYAVTVSDDFGCVGIESLDLEWLPAPTIDISGEDSFCENSFTSLEAQTDGTFLEWSTGLPNTQIAVSAGGEYTAFAINDEGCIGSRTIEVTENPLPVIQFEGEPQYCVGDSTSIGTQESYVSYEWSTTSLDSSLVINAPGIYDLAVVDSNGCSGNNSIVITENPLPVIPLSDTIFCNNEEIILNAGDEFASYLWSDNSMEATLLVATPGNYAVSVTDQNNCENAIEIEVTSYFPPEPEIEGIIEFCLGESTTLSVVDTFVNYSWSDFSDTPSVMVSGSDEVWVEVTDQNGCIGRDTVTLSNLPLPEFEIIGNPNFCLGDSTVLSATNGFETYEWQGSIIADSIWVNEAGDISLTVTDDQGCSSTQNIEVLSLALPIANPGDSQTLNCELTSVPLGPDNIPNDLTFEWDGPGINTNNQNDAQPIVDQAGIYSLVVIDELTNCVSEISTVEIFEDTDEPVFEFTSSTLINCNQASITSEFTFNDSLDDFTVAWQDQSGNSIPADNEGNISFSTSGWYFLEVQNANNLCTYLDSIFIDEDFELPTVEAGDDAFINCDSPDVILEGSSSTSGVPISFAWSTMEGNILNGANTSSPRVDQEGIYVLILTNENNGCSNIDSVLVTGDFIEPEAIAGPDQLISCFTGTALLDGSSSSQGTDFRYVWSNNSGFFLDDNVAVQVPDIGVYYLEVTNLNNGCSAIDSVIVSPDPEAIDSIGFVIDQPICSGDDDGRVIVETVVGGRTPYLYSINGGDFSADRIFSDLSPGIYSIQVEDARGCKSLNTIEIIDGDTLTVDLGPDQYINFGEGTLIEPLIEQSGGSIVERIWSNSSQESCDNCLEWEVQPPFTTQYFLELINENGCVAMDDVNIFVDRRKKLHIPNAFSPNNDNVNDQFTIFGGENVVQIETLKIFDRWGTLLFERNDFLPNDETLGWDGTFNGQPMNAAIYVFYASVLFNDGEVEEFKGDILLIR